MTPFRFSGLFQSRSGTGDALNDRASQRLTIKAHARFVSALAIFLRWQNIAHPFIRQTADGWALNKQPLTFAEAGGRKTEVRSFGILHENHDARDKLWRQPRVLFRKGEPRENTFEFAIDLCTNSSPSQLVIAKIGREPTLSAAIARVEREMAEMPQLVEAEAAKSGRYTAERLHVIESTDAMLVPDFHWAISHRFTQLEGNRLANERFKGRVLGVAQQDILFRLDKSGVELKSEAKAYAAGEPTHYLLDRPFLVYLKKRGANMPYFVMWVDNAELLSSWSAKGVVESSRK